MSRLIILGADRRPVVGKCRVCGTVWREGATERTMVRHMARCARDLHERTHAERRHLDFLRPQDPELEAWMRREYSEGRLRPDTKPV